MTSGELKSLAEKALREAHKAGARHAEAFVSASDYREVEIEKGSIKRASVIRDEGVGLRVLMKGGVGQASTVDLSTAGIRVAARDAVRIARLSRGDPKFTNFAPARRVSAGNLRRFDPTLAALAPGWLAATVGKCLAEARRADRRTVLNGGAVLGIGGWWVANSEGVSTGCNGTIAQAAFTALLRRGEDAGTFSDFSVSRSLEGFHPVEAARKAAAGASRYLGSRTIGTTTLPVILGPLVTGELLSGVAWAANAESVQFKRSFLAGKKGEAIASTLLTLEDDGLVPGGVMTAETDAEGVPKRRMTLLEAGRLSSYLYNMSSAMKDGVESNGHGARGGFAGGVGIGTNNLRLRPGRGTVAELIADTKEGIYLENGSLAPHGVTGAVSTTLDFGFKVERGRLAYPLKTTMVGGQVQEWLKAIDRVTAEGREDAGQWMPAIRIPGVRVAGAGKGK